jgi:hypothetical protein
VVARKNDCGEEEGQLESVCVYTPKGEYLQEGVWIIWEGIIMKRERVKNEGVVIGKDDVDRVADDSPFGERNR